MKRVFVNIFSFFSQNITLSNGTNYPCYSGQKISERTKKSKPKSEKDNKPIKGALKKKITDEQFWLAVLIFGENYAKKNTL